MQKLILVWESVQKSVYSGQLAGPVYTRIRIVGHYGACCCVQWTAKMTTVHDWDEQEFSIVAPAAGRTAFGWAARSGETEHAAVVMAACGASFVSASVMSIGYDKSDPSAIPECDLIEGW